MDLIYNIDFEIVGAIYLLVIYGILSAYYTNELEINKKFKVLVESLIVAEILDIITAITISYGKVIPAKLNIVINTIYFASVCNSSYALLQYVESYIHRDKKRILAKVQEIVYFLMLGVLLVNMFSGFLFTFNGEGEYIHGSLYFLVYAMPMYYVLFAAGGLFRNHKLFKRKQKIAIEIYIFMCVFGPIMQMLFFPDVLLGMFTPSIAALIILFSMETPDYPLLIKTIGELDDLQNHLQEEVKEQTRTVEERGKKLARLSQQIILTLAKTIDAKDKYTHGHSERVANYAKEIAGRMGLSESEQQSIYYMGLLHDIGKIGISDTIINKTGKLTEEEYQIIKTHPLIGEEILKTISEIPDVSVGARHHHERYDGNGYPDGIGGDDIPLAASIIGMADAYDAMTSNHSYRDILPQEVVRNEIVKGKGTQFEPKCAEIMLKIIDEDKEYQKREQQCI